MKKYNISFEVYTFTGDIEIEADSEEEARKEFRALSFDELLEWSGASPCVDSETDVEIYDVEEINED